MPELCNVELIRPAPDDHAIREMVHSLDEADDLCAERTIYYPYFRFSAECKLPALFARRPAAVTCLVDARRGSASTADSFETRCESLPAADVLGPTVSNAEAELRAGRYLRFALMRASRTIGSFEIKLTPAGIVHKAFRIVRSGPHRYMVDTVTGGIHLIERSPEQLEPRRRSA